MLNITTDKDILAQKIKLEVITRLSTTSGATRKRDASDYSQLSIMMFRDGDEIIADFCRSDHPDQSYAETTSKVIQFMFSEADSQVLSKLNGDLHIYMAIADAFEEYMREVTESENYKGEDLLILDWTFQE